MGAVRLIGASTVAVATGAVAAGSATTGVAVLLTGPPSTWVALCASISGLAGIVSLVLERALRSRRSAARPRVWHVVTIAPTMLGATTSLWALISIGAVVFTWVFGAVVLVAALFVGWFESPPETTGQLVLVLSGILAAVAGIGIGAYLLYDNGHTFWGIVISATGIVAAVEYCKLVFEWEVRDWFDRGPKLVMRPIRRTPVPVEIAWVGPVVAVATSVVAAEPLTERLGVPNPGAEVMVSIISVLAGLQWVVQSVIVRTLRPTVESVHEIERQARDARSRAEQLAASVARDPEQNRRIDAGRPTMWSAEDLLERMWPAYSAAEYREIESRFYHTMQFGSDAEMRSLIRDYERRHSRRVDHGHRAHDEPIWARWAPRRASRLRMSRLLVGTATIAVNLATARDAGVVIDRIWPRIELVVPPFVRKRIAWLDRGVALSRVIVASAAAAALTFAAASLYLYVSVPLTFLVLALFAGRSRLELAYGQRAIAIGVYRVELVRALHMKVPANHAELVALGDQLEGVSSPDQLATALDVGAGTVAGVTNITNTMNTAPISDITEQFVEVKTELRELGRRQQDFVRELASSKIKASDIDRLAAELARAAATSLDTRVTETVTTLQTRMDASVAEAVRAAMVGPSLVEFTGYFVVELAREDETIHRNAAGVIYAPPGTTVGLSVSVLADQAARNSSPDRGAASEHSFVALETISIEGRETEAFVHFDVLVDSATMTPSPRRHTLRVPRLNGEQSGSVELELPGIEDAHEAWLQLYQAGRLVQAIAIAVDTRAPERSSRGEP